MGTRSNPSLALRASVVVVLALLGTGCIGRRGNVELLEAHLRDQQDLLARQQRMLAETRSELDLARKDADLLREQLANDGASPIPPEYTATLFQVENIQFNTLLTGGRDQDGVAGDELLVVVFGPYDEHGDLVKLPGRIELEAIDVNRTEEEGRQIARWTFTPEESRDLWRSSLFSAGFELRLVWPEPPSAEKVLLHARLSTADGRHFDATHTIAISPPAGDRSPGNFPAPDIVRPVNYNTRTAPPDPIDPNPFDARSDTVTPLEDVIEMKEQPGDTRPERPGIEPLFNGDDPGTADRNGEAAAASGPAAEETETNSDVDDSQKPRPFPDGLRTSDVWTDETIPRLR